MSYPSVVGTLGRRGAGRHLKVAEPEPAVRLVGETVREGHCERVTVRTSDVRGRESVGAGQAGDSPA